LLTVIAHLVDRLPQVSADRLIAELVPPPRFDAVRFSTYRPDPNEPTQAAAVAALESFADRMQTDSGRGRRWFRRAPAPPEGRMGIYLDGGFGVGKTHLLSSLWHAAAVPVQAKLFCTFVELTNLVGALGFATAVANLSEVRLLCIDEFELDDPGDTVLVSTLLTRLTEAGVRLAATSNTLPDKLGEGRFAAQDFLREVQALSAQFDVLRVDGEDYRHRGLPVAPRPLGEDELNARLSASAPGATDDVFDTLCDHLGGVHPSRYGPLLDGVSKVFLRDVRTVDNQSTALRLVVLVDRLYDREIPVAATGVPVDQLFAPELLRGGYRKKYFRAISRLVALATDR
jgi:cell division protein ZapE